jgi:hypothetical protein
MTVMLMARTGRIDGFETRNFMARLFPTLTALAILALGGCGHGTSDGPYGAKSIDWYVGHKVERTAQLQWCNQWSTAVQFHSAGCSHAAAAAQKA